MKHFYLFILLFIIGASAFAQKKNEAYQLHLRKTTLPVEIDGRMDEAAWQDTDVAKDFFMVLPMDTSRAKTRTEVRMTYDDKTCT